MSLENLQNITDSLKTDYAPAIVKSIYRIHEREANLQLSEKQIESLSQSSSTGVRDIAPEHLLADVFAKLYGSLELYVPLAEREKPTDPEKAANYEFSLQDTRQQIADRLIALDSTIDNFRVIGHAPEGSNSFLGTFLSDVTDRVLTPLLENFELQKGAYKEVDLSVIEGIDFVTDTIEPETWDTLVDNQSPDPDHNFEA